MTPSWLTDSLATLMLAVAAYCAGRVVYARLNRRSAEHEVDVLHVVMGVAMAGMLATRLSILNDRIWEAVFVIAALWFAVHAVLAARSGSSSGDGGMRGALRAAISNRVPYVLACGAMLYMYLAPISASSGAGDNGTAGMSGMADSVTAASRYPLLGLVLAVSMIGYAIVITDRTPLTAPVADSGTGSPTGSVPRISGTDGAHCGLLAPRAANCCHIAMSVTMAYLLVVML